MKIELVTAAGLALSGFQAGAAEIAHSQSEFSAVQGQLGWYAGWRNFTADQSGDLEYNPNTAFIPFTAAQWNGNNAFVLGGNPPWTNMGAENSHPNSGGSEHWTVRRWVAEELTGVTALRLTVHLRKINPNGGGTTGALFQNGVRKFFQAVAGNNTTGYTQTCFLNVLPGDKIDFALTPVNLVSGRDDGSDGSAFHFTVDDDLGAAPYVQPDGSSFEPASAADTDGDSMPDFWERSYSPTQVLTDFSISGDYDNDGLLDRLEYTRGSSPVLPDTDADGLSDLAESKTGFYNGPGDTGSDPAKVDTDADGLTDYAEVTGTPVTDPNAADTDLDNWTDFLEQFYGSNPTVADDTPLSQAAADSLTEFSGIQGQDGWEYGYRNLTLSGISANYDPAAAFIRFAGGADDPNPWTPGEDSPQHWTGSKWDLATGAPWTELGPDASHPNGLNNGAEHWTVRRWNATELTAPTPVTVFWLVRKTNPAGDGVTGAVYLNGKIIDITTISGSETVGSVRKVYVVLKPADVLDLAQLPTGRQEGHDGSDGSVLWMRVDKRIAAEPVSTDGAYFAAPGAADTDGDGLADGWELYATADRTTQPATPGTLTILNAAAADADSDGLTNLQEQGQGTDPLKADTDGDGLPDRVETATGEVVDANNTGTNPRLADSDGDGLSDFAEVMAVQLPSNPWLGNSDGDIYNDANELRRDADPAVTTTYTNGQADGNLAHSILDFSGIQGPVWYYGYRDLRADGGTDPYDPAASFIPIPNFGTNWTVGGNPPWTSLSAGSGHPNGPNGGAATFVHWAVRRFHASPDQFPTAKPLAFWWHLRKQYTSASDGVSAGIYHNGVLLDEAGVISQDLQGITRIVYVMIRPGDQVDFALRHNGPGVGLLEGTDYNDGSMTTLRVSETIPANAVQPDGSPFPAAVGASFQISSVVRNALTGAVTVAWPSQSGKTYDLRHSPNLESPNWTRLTPVEGLPGTGAALTFTDTTAATAEPAPVRIFYRVTER